MLYQLEKKLKESINLFLLKNTSINQYNFIYHYKF